MISGYSLSATTFNNFTGLPSLEKLDGLSFHGFKSLTFIDLTKTSIKSVATSVFWGTTAETIYLPKKAQRIESKSICYTSNIKEIIIYELVETIINSAFFECSNIERIYYFGDSDFTDKSIFDSCDTNKTKINVLESYKGNNFGKVNVNKMLYVKREKYYSCFIKNRNDNSLLLFSFSIIM